MGSQSPKLGQTVDTGSRLSEWNCTGHGLHANLGSVCVKTYTMCIFGVVITRCLFFCLKLEPVHDHYSG